MAKSKSRIQATKLTKYRDSNFFFVPTTVKPFDTTKSLTLSVVGYFSVVLEPWVLKQ